MERDSVVTVAAALGSDGRLMTAARILGLGRTKAYELARHGEFPCRVIASEISTAC